MPYRSMSYGICCIAALHRDFCLSLCFSSITITNHFIDLYAGLSALIGNGLAVIVFRRKGRNITVPEVLLLNIAIVDLFLAIASYPSTIIAAFSHRWVFGEIGKPIYYFHSFLYICMCKHTCSSSFCRRHVIGLLFSAMYERIKLMLTLKRKGAIINTCNKGTQAVETCGKY